MKLSFYSSVEITDQYLGQVLAIDHQEFPQPWSESDWWEIKKKNHYTIFLLTNEFDVVEGFALFSFSSLEPVAHLLKVIVTSKVRKMGLGKKLLGASLLELTQRGATRCFLEVEFKNLPAQALYRSLGFKTLHHKRCFYSNGDDALIMESHLT